MLTLIIVLVLAAVLVFFLTKKGKITDSNHNNIPDVVETKVAKKSVSKNSITKTSAKKVVKKSK